MVRDGPRPPGLHLLFSLPVESTQITESADHRGPKNLFLSEVPLLTDELCCLSGLLGGRLKPRVCVTPMLAIRAARVTRNSIATGYGPLV